MKTLCESMSKYEHTKTHRFETNYEKVWKYEEVWNSMEKYGKYEQQFEEVWQSMIKYDKFEKVWEYE